MKKIIMLFALFAVLAGNAQENLLPNGHFESGTYHGGTSPVEYYTAGADCDEGRDRFEDDFEGTWKVAQSDAPWADVQNVGSWTGRRCSPDWIDGTIAYDHGTYCDDPYTSRYVAEGNVLESVMIKMNNDYHLIKGQSYKFRIRVRSARGAGNFQVVFSTKEEGLRCQPQKKWVAVDKYLETTCDWQNFEFYFTVPNNNDDDYEDMKYMVLQYCNDKEPEGDAVALHFDDAFLAEGQKCEEHKYIQDWQYSNVHKIEQANTQIWAGAHVSPYSWDNQLPVIIRSNSMVIFRAPVVYLEPGFVIEEAGAYFETQVGTCVDDPCPTIPNYVSPLPPVVCSFPQALGAGLPATPGVFYSWSPSQYFSAPWSAQTNLIAPNAEGCANLTLTIWTICGQSKTYSFPIEYYSQAPTIAISNIVSTGSTTSFGVNVQHSRNYSIVVKKASNGTVIYQENIERECNDPMIPTGYSFNRCDFDMCEDLIIQVVANNGCYSAVTDQYNWSAPAAVAPTVNASNNSSTATEYQFDLAVPASAQWVTIELYNTTTGSSTCLKTYDFCNTPWVSSIHYSTASCFSSGCPDRCHSANYEIRVKVKNFCHSTIASQTYNWSKTGTSLTMPSSYPNVITPNGDGINDQLCFVPPAGAEFFDIVITNQWGNVMSESSGCVNSNPLCLWNPGDAITDGVYYYILTYSNTCGQSDYHQDFVQVFAGMAPNPNGQAIDELATGTIGDQLNVADDKENPIFVYPNPTKGIVHISGRIDNSQMIIRDIYGAVVYSGTAISEFDLSKFAAGSYMIEIIDSTSHKNFRIIKE
jgi:hypothetical protein